MRAEAKRADMLRPLQRSRVRHHRFSTLERRSTAPSRSSWTGLGRLATSQTIPADLKRGVVAIGNFDGVHVGHQYLIGHAAEIASALGAPLAILTFEPHPRTFFGDTGHHFRLASAEFKRREFARLGAAITIEERFDADLARCTADEFVAVHLADRLQAQHVVVGADYRFGAGRAGDTAVLERYAERFSFGLSIVEKLQRDGRVVSSSRVRDALGDADVAAAADLLGRPWEVSARVEWQSFDGAAEFVRLASCGAQYLLPKPGLYRVSLHRSTRSRVAESDFWGLSVARVLPGAAGGAFGMTTCLPADHQIALRLGERLLVRFLSAVAS